MSTEQMAHHQPGKTVQAPPPQGFPSNAVQKPRLEPARDPATSCEYTEVSHALVDCMTKQKHVRTYNLFAIIEDVTPATKTNGTGRV